MTQNVIVPKKDLEKIKVAREELYNLLEDLVEDYDFLIKLQKITSPMWEISHKEYKEIK